MCKSVAILIILCSILYKHTDCTTSFDQRQTGDFNLQIGLKNIQLIALLNSAKEDYVDYDYAYDYSEMTIKPQYGTTAKPLNVTNTQSGVANSSSIALTGNATETSDLQINTTASSIHDGVNITETTVNTTEPTVYTAEPTANITEPTINNLDISNNVTKEDAGTPIPTVVSNQTVNVDKVTENNDTRQTKIVLETSTKVSLAKEKSTTLAANKCRRGFVENNQGLCVYKIQGTSNALRRIVKLAQKIKISRGLKGT